MPSTPEIEEKLRQQEAARKRGEPVAFGRTLHGRAETNTTSDFPGFPRRGSAEELVETETLFGEQCLALGAHLRSMLATLAQLQRARMRAFGQGPTREESGFTVAADGFLRHESPPNAPSTNEGGSNGNVSG